MTETLIEARGLTKHFPLSKSFLANLLARGDAAAVHAVDGVDLDIERGEIYGLVGESGSGKTTLGRLLLRLIEPTAGTISFAGRDITRLKGRELRAMRKRMQLVFQDPHASLNPAMTVGDAVAHPLVLHERLSWRDARVRAGEMLEEVGLAPSARFADKRPADLSGGQKQRVVIARAMITRPEFVVADEPVSMLDMSVRAKVIELLLEMKRKHDFTLVFITHDLATAKFLCDRVAILYLGEIVEEGPVREILSAPRHPYARALLRAIPVPDPTRRRTEPIVRGEVPDAITPPAGCRFHPRCPVATPACGFSGSDLVSVAFDALGDASGWSAIAREASAPSRAALDAALAKAPAALAGAVEGIRAEGAREVATFRPATPIGTS
ncbi:MAG: oligopeptide/dipeptide ABC transporter ATP-binding protein, partial [Thermoplasmatota archaeon]